MTDGSVERYKARLVAKGYNQVEGVDYIDRFSPVAKIITIRTFLVVASGLNWPIHQVDINTAFLHGFLDEDFYMVPPEGSSIPAGKVCLVVESTTTPLPTGLKLTAYISEELSDLEPYRRLLGRLLYLSFTHPDISFAAQQLSQFVHKPCRLHMDTALLLVRNRQRLPVPQPKQNIGVWAPLPVNFSGLFLLHDFQLTVPTPIPLYCDNQAAAHIVANPVFHNRTKHLEIDCHLIRDKFKAGFLIPSYIAVFSVVLRKMAWFHFPNSILRGDE
ncbi:UNVERIFIED_CONTAM: Retrovirus-related Pol polyprotein from transposon RE1 [Sesamum latifolium]|uniref:Retrovirus-related Pol polyprotein from transposon RE1 n=1 Tax=Sesamum latifolium TaxID=2727402 RepID=A0AAW2WTY6_9LAMI